MTQEDLDKLTKEEISKFETTYELYQAGFKKALELVFEEQYNIKLHKLTHISELMDYL